MTLQVRKYMHKWIVLKSACKLELFNAGETAIVGFFRSGDADSAVRYLATVTFFLFVLSYQRNLGCTELLQPRGK